jgi:hypothetical protein
LRGCDLILRLDLPNDDSSHGCAVACPCGGAAAGHVQALSCVVMCVDGNWCVSGKPKANEERDWVTLVGIDDMHDWTERY